jgi:type I restriction enzyme R subunit
MPINEPNVEQAALGWLGGLGYEIMSGLAIAPGEPAAERVDYKQVFLFDRLQTKLEDLKEALRDRLLPKPLSGELRMPAPLLRQAGAPANLCAVKTDSNA